jgi:pseudouridine 5'-phosphatase
MGKRMSVSSFVTSECSYCDATCSVAERDAASHLLSFFPDIDLTIDDYLAQRDEAQDALWPTVPLLPGARKLIEHLHKYKVPMAIATGSRRRNYELKTSRLGVVFDLFDGKIVCADDGVIETGRGKPHPDIYLWAAKNLLMRDIGEIATTGSELSPEQRQERARGIVFEDAIPGFQASLSHKVISTSLIGANAGR